MEINGCVHVRELVRTNIFTLWEVFIATAFIVDHYYGYRVHGWNWLMSHTCTHMGRHMEVSRESYFLCLGRQVKVCVNMCVSEVRLLIDAV